MDRDAAKELFSDYLEGLLSAEQRDALESYLERDESARAELEALRRTLAKLSRLPAPPAPSGFGGKVERRIRLRSRGRFFAERVPFRLPFEWFSFVIIMLLLTLYLLLVFEMRRAVPEADGGNTIAPASRPVTTPRR